MEDSGKETKEENKRGGQAMRPLSSIILGPSSPPVAKCVFDHSHRHIQTVGNKWTGGD